LRLGPEPRQPGLADARAMSDLKNQGEQWYSSRHKREMSCCSQEPANSVSPKSRSSFIVAILSMLAAPGLQAATFSSAYYDSKANELVVTMTYRGTNPDHEFSVQWGKCQTLEDDDGGKHQIAAELLDSQWSDDEQQTFNKTVHISLANLNCRPALVTLRTAPRFEYTLQIP